MKNKIKKLIIRYKLWFIVFGVACVPALYNLSFLGSMWNPYSNVKNLPVAVVDNDESYTTDGTRLTIGQDITDKMKKTESLDYHFVDKKTAQKGLKNGKYYMVVTLPSNLSKNASSLLTKNPKKMVISYETAQGSSLFASKISNSAIERLKASVSDNITKNYTKSVFSQLTKLESSISQLNSGGNKLNDGANQLNQGAKILNNGMGQLYEGDYKLSQGASKLSSGIETYTSGVGQLATGLTSLSSGITSYTDGVSQLANGSSQVNENSQTLLNGLTQLSSGTSQINQLTQGLETLEKGLEGTSQLSKASLQELSTLSTQLGLLVSQANTDKESQLSSLKREATNLSTSLSDVIDSQNVHLSNQLANLEATATYQSLTDEQRAELVNALSVNDEISLSSLQTNISNIISLLETLSPGASSLDLQSSQDSLTKANQYIGQLDSVLTSQLTPASQQLIDGSQSLQSGLTQGAYSLQSGLERYTSAVGRLSNGLSQLNTNSSQLITGTAQLQSGSQTLSNNSSSLVTGSKSLVSGIETEYAGILTLQNGSSQLSNGLSALSSNLGTFSLGLDTIARQLSLVSVTDKNADTIARPLIVSHKDKDSVPVNGIAMAPYMVSVSLMVIALSANVVFEKLLYSSVNNNKKKAFKKKLIINSLVALLDTIILYVTLHLMGVEMLHPILTFVLILLGSYVFMAMVTLLILISDQLGSFVALLLLLLQTGSSGGSYPIELSPKVFQILNPYLPMSYLVSGLRQTISRTGQVNHQLIILSAFLVSFIILIYLFSSKKKMES